MRTGHVDIYACTLFRSRLFEYRSGRGDMVVVRVEWCVCAVLHFNVCRRGGGVCVTVVLKPMGGRGKTHMTRPTVPLRGAGGASFYTPAARRCDSCGGSAPGERPNERACTRSTLSSTVITSQQANARLSSSLSADGGQTGSGRRRDATNCTAIVSVLI